MASEVEEAFTQACSTVLPVFDDAPRKGREKNKTTPKIKGHGKEEEGRGVGMGRGRAGEGK